MPESAFLPRPDQYDGAPSRRRVAVLIPCLDEEQTVAEVVRRFRSELPGAAVYVCNNGSSDRTARRAREAGAVVLTGRRRGKGRAVRLMFSRVEADIYLIVDGDCTYPAEAARGLLRPIREGRADMAVGSRWHRASDSRCRTLNLWGNRLLSLTTNVIFGAGLTDVLSGYRALSREFVESARLKSDGFEIEIELTVEALGRGRRVVEVPVDARPRPPGSRSKISLWRDGALIMRKLLTLSYAQKRSRSQAPEAHRTDMSRISH